MVLEPGSSWISEMEVYPNTYVLYRRTNQKVLHYNNIEYLNDEYAEKEDISWPAESH